MPLHTQSFTVHDVSDFPVVRSRPDAITPGYAAHWETEMDALLAQGQHFVVIFVGERVEETHEDRKRRGIWLKKNKHALGRLCSGLVTAEPDGLKRAALKVQSAMLAKAFGIPLEIASSAEEADAIARKLIDSTTAAAATPSSKPARGVLRTAAPSH
jgi:hypothetical protein